MKRTLYSLILAALTCLTGCQQKPSADGWAEVQSQMAAMSYRTELEQLDVYEDSLIHRGKWGRKQVVAWADCRLGNVDDFKYGDPCFKLKMALKNEGTRMDGAK